MNEIHSKYYNCSADEAMKKFKFNYRLWYVIGIILTLSVLIWMIWSLGDFVVTRGMANINGDTIDRTADIYWLLQSIGKICLVVVILFVRTIAYHYETAQLKNVLWEDCDPYKMYDILVLWEQFMKKRVRQGFANPESARIVMGWKKPGNKETAG